MNLCCALNLFYIRKYLAAQWTFFKKSHPALSLSILQHLHNSGRILLLHFSVEIQTITTGQGHSRRAAPAQTITPKIYVGSAAKTTR